MTIFLIYLLQKFFELVQVIFILFFTVYLVDGVNYDKLFQPGKSEKVKLSDVLLPFSECLANMSFQVRIFKVRMLVDLIIE